MLTNAVVTIYHKYFDKTTKQSSFRRHVVSAAHWYADHRVNVDNAGISGAEVYKVRIPDEYLADYLDPDAYLAAGAPETKWTVDQGDYFLKGEGADITKPSDIQGRYAQVRSFGDNRRGGLPHLRIEGW